MEVLHDWEDEECVAILRAIRRAAHDDSRLLVIEGVISEERADPRARTLDIVMLTGGRERTATEFSALFDAAGAIGYARNATVPVAIPVAAGNRSPRTSSLAYCITPLP
ncbi:MAG: methyltransferase [Pseudonocardiaceae bacterium]